MTRNETIVKNAYMVPSFVTPNLEALIGAKMARQSWKEGNRPKLPKIHNITDVMHGHMPDIINVLQNAKRPLRRFEIAEILKTKPTNIHTALARMRERGLVKISRGEDQSYLYSVDVAL